MLNSVSGYEDLERVLALAYDRAARGKGAERHADALPFRNQWIMQGLDVYGFLDIFDKLAQMNRMSRAEFGHFLLLDGMQKAIGNVFMAEPYLDRKLSEILHRE